jgi:hypothetical protein
MTDPSIVASHRLHLRVWATRGRLDRALAAGAAADHSAELALRATQLSRPATRRSIAAMLSNVLEAAAEPPGAVEREAPAQAVNRAAVVQALDDLIALIVRLRDDEAPASAQGIAQAHLLAVDSRGPLYGRAPASALIAAIELAQSTLDTLA